MANKLQTLLQTVIGDGARPAKYMLNIDRIPGTESTNADLPKKLAIMCKGATFPGKTLTTVPFEYKGRPILIPSHVKYDQTFEVSFYLDEAHSARIIFMDWMQAFDEEYESYYGGAGGQRTKSSGLNNGSILTNNIRNLGNDYNKVTTVRISQLDFDLTKKTAEYVFHNCFPTSVSSISVDDSQVGAVLEYSVTFTYSHMLIYNPKDTKYEFSLQR
jgi:hypothetical protein